MEIWIVLIFVSTIIKCKDTIKYVLFYFIFFFLFFSFSLWSRGWENDPTSVLPLGMPLSPITRATVVIFSELGFAVSI